MQDSRLVAIRVSSKDADDIIEGVSGLYWVQIFPPHIMHFLSNRSMDTSSFEKEGQIPMIESSFT